MPEITKDKVIELVFLVMVCAILEILCIAIWFYRGQGFDAFDVVVLMMGAGVMFIPIAYAKLMLGVRIP